MQVAFYVAPSIYFRIVSANKFHNSSQFRSPPNFYSLTYFITAELIFVFNKSIKKLLFKHYFFDV